MTKRYLALILAAGLASAAQGSTLSSEFSSYYAFGDSLSDDGKAPALPAPSVGGRFSNGPVYAEIIGDVFTAARLPEFNFAFGGATAGDLNDNDLVTPPALSVPFGTFGRQVNTFLTSGAAVVAGDTPLVSVLFGANDFLQNASEADFNPVAVARKVVENIKEISKIANFDNFLVFNLPDFSLIPASSGLSDVERAALRGGTQLFNATLAAELAALRAVDDPSLKFEIFDLFGEFNRLLAQAGDLNLRLDGICTPRIVDPTDFNICPTAEVADAFFFVDGVHPNRIVHAEIAETVIAGLDGLPTPVPLPAALPFLLMGLGGFGLVAARRSRKV
ncbi:SGNH/GDSL hydrolase family protein [uncultured Roseobacter sp.]|uniref:SGNH/GDSL hydrolase family protein n=1 Tax=uncultured Roseobacter sp. TaxID=114847 RepID=UPI0026284FFE|nr:SGNH/GDSL hydrolase family protein [uncultured Roseobacter sp.]